MRPRDLVTRTPTAKDLVAGLHKKVKGLIHLLGKIVVDAVVDQSEARRRLAYDPWLATDGSAGPIQDRRGQRDCQLGVNETYQHILVPEQTAGTSNWRHGGHGRNDKYSS